MTKMYSERDLVTVDDFFALVPDGQKADLIDGVIYIASPDSTDNDQLCGFIRFLVQGYARVRRLGKVFGSRYAFELSHTRAPEPDVAFVSTARLHLVEKTRMKGAPDIAVEIVARESRTRDYLEKKNLYESSGVLEYWIIDPLQRRAEFYRLNYGQYHLVPLEQNRIFRSDILLGFWIDVEWLFADELPDEFEKLQEILNPQRPSRQINISDN